MKKITFLVASVLMTTTILNATEVNITSTENRMRHNFDEPISFVERGIEFFVFANGDFDFNTRPQDSQGDYFYRTAGKRVATVARRQVNYGTRIEHDSFGRVRRVGNTFINYDANDRVNRIGSVYMRYNRIGLTQIGGMKIVYNRRGDIVSTYGTVKGYRNQGFVYTYNNNSSYNDAYAVNDDDDDNYYYYRHDGTKARIADDDDKK
jgi:hypothetical protein